MQLGSDTYNEQMTNDFQMHKIYMRKIYLEQLKHQSYSQNVSLITVSLLLYNSKVASENKNFVCGFVKS